MRIRIKDNKALRQAILDTVKNGEIVESKFQLLLKHLNDITTECLNECLKYSNVAGEDKENL